MTESSQRPTRQGVTIIEIWAITVNERGQALLKTLRCSILAAVPRFWLVDIVGVVSAHAFVREEF